MAIPTPPPPHALPAKSRKSFFHQAATASVWAPLFAIGANILSTVSQTESDPQTRRTVSLITGIACTFILLMGVIFGIIALCGIPKYGRKGILTKALCGTLIPLVLFGLSIPYFMAMRPGGTLSQVSLEGQLRVIADKADRDAGKMIDPDTRLDGAEVFPGKKIAYKYTITTKTADEIPLDMLSRAIRPNLVKVYNSDPDMKPFRENGITLIYRYRDKAGLLIGDISVGPNDLVK